MTIRPAHLEFGDTLGLISPASPPADPKDVDAAIAALEELGFKVKPGRNLRKRLGFLAGTDRERASDLMTMFFDKKVNGIVCLRGGYGTPRILPLLDYKAIRQNPKVFVGCSDITALLCAFLKKSNLNGFHGPMPVAFVRPEHPEFSRTGWLKAVTRPMAPGSICEGYEEETISILRRGMASGILVGGNLSLLAALMGTPFQPDFRDKILFLEDVDEKPYRIDRMLTQLLLSGALDRVAGIAIGVCKGCEDPKAATAGEFRQSAADVFKERVLPLKVPMVMGLPFGHIPFNATLPVGIMATLDANKGDLIITEPAVV
jgi:muramoyltetrapeptide carboxypeptidase